MKRVIVESPFAGEVERNEMYTRMCLHDCIVSYHQAPFASHLLYTQEFILDDQIPSERQLGIDAGLVWGEMAAYTVVYVDLGISTGMAYGIRNARDAERPIDVRMLPGDMWDDFRYNCVQREFLVPEERAFLTVGRAWDAINQKVAAL